MMFLVLLIMSTPVDTLKLPSGKAVKLVGTCYDIDNDGLCAWQDNCPKTANADQKNIDGDLLGDACDPDMDGDGIANDVDPDMDGDGILNVDDCDYNNVSNLYFRYGRYGHCRAPNDTSKIAKTHHKYNSNLQGGIYYVSQHHSMEVLEVISFHKKGETYNYNAPGVSYAGARTGNLMNHIAAFYPPSSLSTYEGVMEAIMRVRFTAGCEIIDTVEVFKLNPTICN